LAHSLMTAAEVADLLGVPRSWVYERSRRGAIPTVTLGRYRRYRREAIEAWVKRLELDGESLPGAAGSGESGARRNRAGFTGA
jgi:excisionase family DNA binding protein